MATSIANINGANPRRLYIEQLGSNKSEGVLVQPLLEEASKYDVTIEDFYISSDLPIFPKGTKVFTIIRTRTEDSDDGLEITTVEDDNIEHLELIQSHRICTVGPVYNFLDFAHQIQEFFIRFNVVEQATYPAVECNLDGSLVPQKILSFVAPREFWQERFFLVDLLLGFL